MFCNQCEQTAKGTGCNTIGVCGKQPKTAALQDLLLHTIQGLCEVACTARKHKLNIENIDHFIVKAVFITITNVNFDNLQIANYIKKTFELREKLKKEITTKINSVQFSATANLIIKETIEEMIIQGQRFGTNVIPAPNEDILSLKQTLIYGIKGLCAYADHAAILGKNDAVVFEFIQRALAQCLDKGLSLETALDLTMECGKINLRAMELLDEGNTEKFGTPIPTNVPLGTKKGHAILVSGHDLLDLEKILEQTIDKNINIYTHGEMLPCHGYPKLKKYPHFYGHYGTAWQNQAKEFATFPGAIIMTTNCIQMPKPDYMENIFTCGLVGWPNVKHIENQDFSPAIEKSLSMKGFAENTKKDDVFVGFGHNAVLEIADKIIDNVKTGQIKHFFLVGGCDGARLGRNYYTEFVEKIPKDCIILTLACGKFRFFDKKLGNINEIPRLLDIGQCNDAYSAIKIASALANAFQCGINELPLSIILSWYEQKAVVILLTLLSLGVKNIKLGPSLPAFITPNILNILVENYGITAITTPEQDLKQILG